MSHLHFDIKTPCYDDPWIEMAKKSPEAGDYPVWVYAVEGPSQCPGVFLWSQHRPDTVWTTDVTHWKSAKIILPRGPLNIAAHLNAQNHPEQAALTAWRQQNPDYAPDDLPPDSFVAAFKAKAVMSEAVKTEAEYAVKQTVFHKTVLSNYEKFIKEAGF